MVIVWIILLIIGYSSPTEETETNDIDTTNIVTTEISTQPTIELIETTTELLITTTTEKVTHTTTKESKSNSAIVYVTNSGKKYHRSGCFSLSKSKIEISLEDAKGMYSPCNRCNPPT